MKRLLPLLLLAFPLFAADVEGWVYAADGTPVTNATVTAYLPEGSAEQLARMEKRAARTALATAKPEDGHFKLTGLPESVIDVDVRAEGFGPVIARTVADDLPLTVTLQPVAMREGRVTAAGKPVADAYVVWIGQNEVEYAAATDAAGRYRLPDPGRWAQSPRILHPGYAPVVFTVRGPEALDFKLEPRAKDEPPAEKGGGSISGTVSVGGKPLAGAPVMIQAMAEGFVAPIRVITDAKGQYQVKELPARRYLVLIGDGLSPRFRSPHAGRMYEEGREPQNANLETERSATVDIALTRAPIVTGRVVDAEGKPVAGAQVQVILAGRSALDFLFDVGARTLADGRYAVAASTFEPTESLTVAVTRRLHSTVRSKPFLLGTADQRVDITLPKFEAVTLRVVDREGKPVSKAQVAFAASEETAAFEDPRMLLAQPFVSRAARVGEAGELSLHLAAGTYDFAALADGYQRGTIAGRTIERSATVELPLDPAFALRGRVHRNGKGVAGVQVSIVGDRRGEDMPAPTGADGSFEIPGLGPGKVHLSISKYDELINRLMTVEVPSTVDVALPPAGSLTGRVVDAATREPVPEFVYSLEPLDSPADVMLPRGIPMLQRGTDTNDGTFTATVSAGSYRVSASATGFVTSDPIEVRISDREPAQVVIPLGRGITISGRVTDEAGTPIGGAEIFASSADPERLNRRSAMRVGPGNVQSADDGTFSISGIEAGPVTLMARKEGYVPFRKGMEVDNAMISVDVRMLRGLAISGIVTRGGRPVAEANVGATTAAIGGDHQPAITDSNGRFTLRGLLPARYTVSAFKDDVHTEVRDVDPTQARELAISLDPRATGVIYGSVHGIPPMPGKMIRRVVFASNNETGAEGLIDESGNYRIENAPTGEVWIMAQVVAPSTSLSSARKSVTVGPRESLRVDLEVGASYTVRGRITHESRPVRGARVMLASEFSVGASVVTRDDGSYEISVATPGKYQMFVHAEQVTSVNHQSVREIKGGETIDVDLREQTVEGTVVDAESRQPISGALITLVPEGLAQQTMSGESVTDPNGRFRIVTAASGAHRIIASARGYAQQMQSAALGKSASTQLAFELQPAAELRVRVIDARTGTPLDAHLILETADGGYLPIRSHRTPDGDTYLFSLAPGQYRLTAVVHGYATKKVTLSAPGVVEVRME